MLHASRPYRAAFAQRFQLMWLAPAAPLAGFVFLALSFWVWRFDVRHYTSTGS